MNNGLLCRRVFPVVFSVFLICGLVPWPAFSASYYVDASRPDDSGDGLSWSTAKQTIQAAVDLALVAGDVVYVTNGIYNKGGRKAPGYSLTNRVCVTRPILVQSVYTSLNTRIVGASDASNTNGLGAAAVRCVFLTNGASMRGFWLYGGRTKNVENNMDSRGGGALMFTNTSLIDCVVIGCSARYGGGVHLRRGGTLSGGYAVGNTAVASGGGVLIYDSGTVTNCYIGSNKAYDAGGGCHIENSGCVSRCSLINNTANTNGGGMVISSGGVVSGCIFSNNTGYNGGGILLNVGGITENCEFRQNTAKSFGGGAAIYGAGGIINNSIISGNIGVQGGGVAQASGGTVNNCLLIDNRATQNGGGTYQLSGGRINNCTISGNSCSNLGGGALQINGGTVYNSIIAGNTRLGLANDYTNIASGLARFNCSPSFGYNTNGNISGDPLFVRDGCNYRLQKDSPCVDRGDDDSAPTNFTPVDLAGYPRITRRDYRTNVLHILNRDVDMGAYEFGWDTPLDFDGDGVSDIGCYIASPGSAWYVYRSSKGFWTTQYGFAQTEPVTGDYDGDGFCDYGVYHAPNGAWNILCSGGGSIITSFGYDDTEPLTGDFDGDAICDFGCYYPPDGAWYIYKSKDGFWTTNFGYGNTVPITGDYDGDGISDFGCYHAPDGGWFIYCSKSGFQVNHFGYEGTVPLK